MSEKLQAAAGALNSVAVADDPLIRQFHPELIHRMDVEGADGWECVEIVGSFDSHGNYLLKRGYKQDIVWLDHENDMHRNWMEYYYCYYCGEWWCVENTPEGWKRIEHWMMEDSCDHTIMYGDLPEVGCWLENTLERGEYDDDMWLKEHQAFEKAMHEGYGIFCYITGEIESDVEVLQLVRDTYGDLCEFAHTLMIGVMPSPKAAVPINQPVTFLT